LTEFCIDREFSIDLLETVFQARAVFAGMAPGITEDDLKRIAKYVREPPHRRRPEMLRPDNEGNPGTRAVDDG